jgi:hypothetical protein
MQVSLGGNRVLVEKIYLETVATGGACQKFRHLFH